MKNLGSDSKLSTDPSVFVTDTMSGSEVWFPSEPKSQSVSQHSSGQGTAPHHPRGHRAPG